MRYRLNCGIATTIVCLAAACTPSSSTPSPPPASDPQPSSPQSISATVAEGPDERSAKDSPIVTALEKEVTCDFQETPLGEVVTFLEAKLGVEIEIDRRALDEVGLDASSPVSLTVRDISGEAALHHLLHSIDWALTFTVEDEVLKITTRVAAEEHLQTVAYSVGDLTVRLDVDEVIAIDKHFKGFNEDRQFDRLIDVILHAIEPDSWSDVGGPGDAIARGTTLTVSQTWEIQRKVDQLLAALRAARDGQTIQPVPDAKTAAIEKALDAKIDLDFAEAPLRDMAANLSERTGTQILLQQAALDEFGIDGDVAVTIHVKDVSLRSALRLILADIDPALVYEVRHEALMITTRESTEGDLQFAVYPVGHLVKRATEQAATNRADYDGLIDNIRTTIEPDSWDEVGGAGSISAFSPCQCLVVSQTYEIHRRIKELLAKLSRAANAIANEAPPAAPQAAPPSDPYRAAIYHLWRPKPDGPDETPPAEGEEAVAATPPDEVPPDNDTSEEDRIAKVVKSSVDPASWRNDEASIESLPGKLVIRQRESVHNKIFGLLQSLELLGDRYEARSFGGSGAAFGDGFGDFGDNQEFGSSKGLDFFFTEPAPEEDFEPLTPPTSKQPANDLDDDPFSGDPFGDNPFGRDPNSTDEADPPDDQQPEGENRPLDNPEAVSLPIRDWFARANRYLKSLDAKKKQTARLLLAGAYAGRGRLERVKTITTQFADPQRRKECAIYSVVQFLFATGNAKRAIEFASELDGAGDRDAVLRTIANKQADWHRFSQAVKTTHMIKDRQEANHAWKGIAIDQARAGKFAAAQRSIDAMTISTDEDRNNRADIREIIKQRRASGEIDEPQIRGQTARDCNDRKLQVLKAFSIEEIAEIEAGLDEIESEFERAQTLQALGVAYLFKGDLDRANDFADDALATARTIEDRLQRVLLFAYVADLMVQLERKEEARALAKAAYQIGREKALYSEPEADPDAKKIAADFMFNMFADMARAPLLATVLLATGEADAAFAFAQQYAKEKGDNMLLWSTIGKWHAEKSLLDELAQRLESVNSAEAKFYLCIGVLDYLVDVERRLRPDAAH